MQKIISEVEPPCFVYEMAKVEKQIDRLQSKKPSYIEVFYAMKANPLEDIINLVLEKNFGIETTSIEEMKKALSLDFNPSKILLTGPGKNEQTIDYAIKNNIGLIIVESIREAKKVNNLALKYNKEQSILIRISPKEAIQGQDLKEGFALFGGKPVKYGIDEESVLQFLPVINNMSNLNLKGIHIFAASGVREYRYLIDHIGNIFHLVKQIQNNCVDIPVINFGGGFGYSYDDSYEFDVSSYFISLDRLVDAYDFQNKKLILELGTYIVAPSGTYIAEIVDVKASRGEYFLIVDGGIHHLLRPSLVSNHSIQLYDNNGEPINAGVKSCVTIAGNLCHPLDILAKNVEINLDSDDFEKLIGGRVKIFNCGAYGNNFSVKGFSMREDPKIYSKIGNDYQEVNLHESR